MLFFQTSGNIRAAFCVATIMSMMIMDIITMLYLDTCINKSYIILIIYIFMCCYIISLACLSMSTYGVLEEIENIGANNITSQASKLSIWIIGSRIVMYSTIGVIAIAISDLCPPLFILISVSLIANIALLLFHIKYYLYLLRFAKTIEL
jgi:hypothetical protein